MDKLRFTERLADRRRALHQIPEPGFQEVKTQQFLLDIFKQLPDAEVHTWETGIVVFIPGTEGARTIGWRSDMDGLPITEETGLPFASKHEGMMHACGHDMHMTIGSTLVEYFAANKPASNLVFFFQPAEEGPGGAEPMLKSELFERFRPDEMYALHIAPEYRAGTVAVKPGILFANTSELFIDLWGKGGHAAFPDQTEDMVVAAGHLVTQLQTVVSRNVDPLDAAVVTIGKMEAGTKQNIIAGHARLEGTIRTLSQAAMQEVKGRVESLAAGIEAAFRCRAVIDYGANYMQVYNDEKLTAEFMTAARSHEAVTLVECGKAMTGEDFGYFLEEVPGVMFWLGVNSEHGLHSSMLDPDESAMEPAVNWLISWLGSR
ncbi:N-acetyldiaminopimelate deacetylase [Alkalicoccus luteus]|uniref:N-acetyldiaminopimelate deacetylase n=1 Tax=Alkalicoccus luteus TaxID=1237094 RepID=A0A969PVL3_9BACI|nr:N-acetyldiaminopimelate deacetylase [Alkalicoccus luteus]NJP39181.1 N-acetyldiaminopimelate deacetylase [Alkalicoccus luteus]